jgi:hypothetical protein
MRNFGNLNLVAYKVTNKPQTVQHSTANELHAISAAKIIKNRALKLNTTKHTVKEIYKKLAPRTTTGLQTQFSQAPAKSLNSRAKTRAVTHPTAARAERISYPGTV